MNQDKIAALKECCEAMIKWRGAGFPVDDPYDTYPGDFFDAAASPEAILALVARLGATEKDAARYRWLRAQYWNNSAFAVVSEPKRNVKLGTYCPSEDRLDQEIDSAMGADHGI